LQEKKNNKKKMELKSDRKKPNKDEIKKYPKSEKLQLKELGLNLKD
jgi:hypothetical protein